MNESQKGITIIEVILVTALVLTLLVFALLRLPNPQSTQVSTALTTLVSDIKNQQTKAMVGDTEGRGVPDNYSIYIQANKYTLFHGATFSSSDPSNFPLAAENGYQFSTTFAGGTIVFATSSGEIQNFNPAQNSVTYRNVETGQQKTLLFNKYGTITDFN